MKRPFLIALNTTLFALAGLGAATQAADDLEKQLLQQAPEIIKTLQGQGYKNVGILKFRVKKGNEPLSDRVGTLNHRLAEKLELAMVVVNPINTPIGIIRNASKTAATIPGANHLTPEGRAKLFTKEYELAWGDTQVTPDIFIVGIALITPDLQTMSVGLMTFDAKNPQELKPLEKFDVKPDLEELLDSGESFSVRGVFDKANLQLTEDERKDKATTEAVQTSLVVKKPVAETPTTPAPKTKESKQHPLSPDNADSLVSLEIRYDNQPQPIEFQGGIAFVAEPKENQDVVFVVRRKGADRQRLGVVLKVNGESTLRRQKSPDAQCSPWIFEPTLTEFGVIGYQVDGKSAEKFKVLSQAESKAKEIDYGEFVGQISISVFKEQTVTPKASPQVLTDDAEDFALMTKGAFPKTTPVNLGALKAQLAQGTTRGLIAVGAKVGRDVETKPFTMDSVPIMTATVRYYNPQDLPNLP